MDKSLKRRLRCERRDEKVMNQSLLRLLELIKIFNGGEVDANLVSEFEAFAEYEDRIETIDELIEAMEEEMSYWEHESDQ